MRCFSYVNSFPRKMLEFNSYFVTSQQREACKSLQHHDLREVSRVVIFHLMDEGKTGHGNVARLREST